MTFEMFVPELDAEVDERLAGLQRYHVTRSPLHTRRV